MEELFGRTLRKKKKDKLNIIVRELKSILDFPGGGGSMGRKKGLSVIFTIKIHFKKENRGAGKKLSLYWI